MRTWRETHSLTEKQKIKSNARSYAKMYLRRGKLTKKRCEKCGDEEVQMHHEDYSKPLSITWLCKTCHRAYHKHNWVDWNSNPLKYGIEDYLEQKIA